MVGHTFRQADRQSEKQRQGETAKEVRLQTCQIAFGLGASIALNCHLIILEYLITIFLFSLGRVR